MKYPTIALIGLWVAILANNSAIAQTKLPRANPGSLGLDTKRLDEIDAIVKQGIKDKKMPGAVVCIGHRGKIVHLKAFGHRQLLPEKVPMTIDTVFDMASLTKPMATATSVMILIEQGKIGLQDRITDYIPEFAQNGKSKITIEQLLTHTAGLIPDNSIKDYDDGVKKAMERIYALKLFLPIGTKFKYTDV